ncbi:hypothetical protein [Glycomyces arizonensis]|uniref:hypothetical protein n=1 Tax=Glycomyces arizonensis TaxID=256035 RepID=UPI000417599D|nr:hypothetical protein [Glycomyces arizonensis]
MFGLDRKAVPRDLRLSYRNNRDHYVDLRGRPTRSRPLFHRDSALEVIPSRFAASSGAPLIAEPGGGLLELVLDSAATMPVAAVDGEPVAVGDGRVLVALPAGRHVVEVQCGDTCSPVVAEIEEGRTASLFWREEADRYTRHFGPRETSTAIPKSLVYLYEWAAVVVVLCGLPVAVVNAFSIDEAGSVAAVVSVVAIAAILLVFLPWRKRERARVAELKLEGERPGLSEIVHYPWDGPAAPDRPELLGERPERLPEFAPGRGALLLRLRAHRHLWKDGDGVRVRDSELASLMVEAPRVRIDGLEQPATWGNWWYPLPPGPHEIEVSYDAVPRGANPSDAGAMPDRISERLAIEVGAGEATALRAEGHVFVHREAGDGGRILADEGSLFMDPEAFHVDWMDDPAKRIGYWDTTV